MFHFPSLGKLLTTASIFLASANSLPLSNSTYLVQKLFRDSGCSALDASSAALYDGFLNQCRDDADVGSSSIILCDFGTKSCTYQYFTGPGCQGTPSSVDKTILDGRCQEYPPDLSGTSNVAPQEADAVAGFGWPRAIYYSDNDCQETIVQVADQSMCRSDGQGGSFQIKCAQPGTKKLYGANELQTCTFADSNCQKQISCETVNGTIPGKCVPGPTCRLAGASSCAIVCSV